jgi:hypothetical protein
MVSFVSYITQMWKIRGNKLSASVSFRDKKSKKETLYSQVFN